MHRRFVPVLVVTLAVLLVAITLAGVWGWLQYVAFVRGITIAPIPVPSPP